MKLTIEQNHLAALIDRAGKGVEKRNTIPILGHILLQAEANTLTATGTDLEVSITTTAEAQVYSPGGCTVSSDLFIALVKKLRSGSLVTLESDGVNLSVTSGRSKLNLSCLPINDFPKIASDEYAITVKATQAEVKRLFDLTAFAMSSEETRYYLKGVYLHEVDGNIRAVSTDGHRLAQIDSQIESNFPPVIVPSKTVGLIRALLDTEGDITIQATENQKFRVDVGHSVIVSKVVDGTFPDYTRVIPKQHHNSVTFNAGEAKQAIGLVQLISQQKTRAVKIDVREAQVGFYVQDSAAGDGFEAIDGEIVGENVSIGVNGKYALDCLALADKGEVTIHYGSGMDPMLITYDSEPNFLSVVMPVRI